MMNNKEYIKIIEDLINETEGKIQEAEKSNRAWTEIESLKSVVKYLQEKKVRLTDKNDK
ncbi:MAG TPA: hypothetical protein VLB84_14950 [Bacteroidia bacterium]|nr:hypothetical protein [Bacteroidia bacterium]